MTDTPTDRSVAPVRILLHAPTADALARARRNRANILADAPDAAVVILANAAGAGAAVAEADSAGVDGLAICANSLRAQTLTAPADAATVPNAMLEIAARTAAGWTYVRA